MTVAARPDTSHPADPETGLGTVAVIAHGRKSLDGGLDELRSVIAGYGVDELIWHEVRKSRKAPKRVRKALEAGAELIVVWGGNPVSTQINVMTQIARARREQGAKLVVVDPYRTGTAELADMHLALLPGARRGSDLGNPPIRWIDHHRGSP